jgi:hypothetical protein
MSWGQGAPGGTPNAQFYFDTDADSVASSLFFGGDGLAWTQAFTPTEIDTVFISPGTNAALVQSTLDSGKAVCLLPGTHIWTTPVVLKATYKLFGFGRATVVRWAGSGNYAIEFGETGQQAFDIYLSDLILTSSNDAFRYGGGIDVKALHQASAIERVIINASKEHGISITGSGEGLRFNGVIIRDTVGNAVDCRITNQTITTMHFTQCNFQGCQGSGVAFEGAGTTQIENTEFHQCIIQGNGLNGTTVAEISLKGLVTQTAFRHCWIERANGSGITTGILLDTNGTYSPGHVIIDDDTYMYGYTPWTTDGRCAIKVKSASRPPLLGACRIVPIGTSGGSYNDGSTVRYKANLGTYNPPRGQYRNYEDFDFSTSPGTWGQNQLIFNSYFQDGH